MDTKSKSIDFFDRLKKFLPVIALGFCLLLAGILMAVNIAQGPLWLDEAMTALSLQPFHRVFISAISGGISILHLALLAAWAKVFGDGEVALRALSAVFALAVINWLYVIARDLWHSKKAGLLAAMLGATSYFLLWYGLQVKTYTLAAFFSLAGFYFFARASREPKGANYFFYGLTLIIGVYVHPWMLLVAFAHFLNWTLFFRRIKKPWRLLRTQLVAGLLSVPALFVILFQERQGMNRWIAPPDWASLRNSFLMMTHGSGWIYFGFAAVAAGYLAYQLLARRVSWSWRWEYVALLVFWLFPYCAAFLISLSHPMFVPGRYELVVFPFFLLLLAGLFHHLPLGFFSTLVLTAALIFSIVSNFALDHWASADFASSDKTVAEKIVAQSRPGDVLIATDLSWATLKYYVDRDIDPKAANLWLMPFPSAVAAHPGFLDWERILDRPGACRQEVDDIMATLQNRKTKTIWVAYRANNVCIDLLTQRLKDNFKFQGAMALLGPRYNSWFQAVLKFKGNVD